MKAPLSLSAHRTGVAVLAAVVVCGCGLLAFEGLRDALVFELAAVLAAATVAFSLTTRKSAVWQDPTEEIEPVHLPDTGKLPVLDEEVEEARRTLVAEWPVFMH